MWAPSRSDRTQSSLAFFCPLPAQVLARVPNPLQGQALQPYCRPLQVQSLQALQAQPRLLEEPQAPVQAEAWRTH